MVFHVYMNLYDKENGRMIVFRYLISIEWRSNMLYTAEFPCILCFNDIRKG